MSAYFPHLSCNFVAFRIVSTYLKVCLSMVEIAEGDNNMSMQRARNAGLKYRDIESRVGEGCYFLLAPLLSASL